MEPEADKVEKTNEDGSKDKKQKEEKLKMAGLPTGSDTLSKSDVHLLRSVIWLSS